MSERRAQPLRGRLCVWTCQQITINACVAPSSASTPDIEEEM